MRFRRFAPLLTSFAIVTFAPVLHAQTEKEPATGSNAAPGGEAGAEPAPSEGEAGAQPTEPKTEIPGGVVEDPNDPAEDPSKTYYFVGLRYRHTFLPKFMLNMFVAGGPSAVSIPSFGIEGTMRKDGFDTILHLTYQDWSMEPFPFKGKDEANVAWELVTSNLKLIHAGVDLLWGTDFSKQFSFQYGVTAGLAIVLGDLKRVQGYPANGNGDDPDQIRPCAGPRNPNITYCGTDNNHYGDYTEPSWFSGGSRPNIYATFGPQFSFRYKPVKQFVARADVGFNIFAGFFFGLGANYGF
jgi:hypothetical protein